MIRKKRNRQMQSVILMVADSHDRLCQNSCYNANNHRENNGYLQDCIKIVISFSFITFSIGLGDKYTHCRAEGKKYGKKISFGCVVKETAEIAGFPRQAIIFVSIVAIITDTRLSRMAGNAIFKNSIVLFILIFICSIDSFYEES